MSIYSKENSLKLAKAEVRREHPDLETQDPEQFDEWVKDLLLEWNEGLSWEVQTYGAPYEYAQAS